MHAYAVQYNTIILIPILHCNNNKKKKTMLVRRYIAQRLREYYAQPAARVVGSTTTTPPPPPPQQSAASGGGGGNNSNIIPFRRLLGEFHWKRKFAQLYQQQQGQWLTPSELFRPYYSNVIARCIVARSVVLDHGDHDHQHNNSNKPLSLHIVELGGGRGTHAVGVMDFLQQQFPELYERTRYTIVDASPTLLELQRQTIVSSRHNTRMRISQKDLVEVGEGKVPLLDDANNTARGDEKQYFVVGLELLDNLAHDKIRVRNTKVEQAELVAIEDSFDENGDEEQNGGAGNQQQQPPPPLYEEVFRPLSDPLLTEIIDAAPVYKRIRRGGGVGLWVPSVACGLLQQIRQQLPNCQILLADFDFLPPSDAAFEQEEEEDAARSSFPADGQPLITDMNDVDCACYLQPTATPTDVLFPTDFAKLSAYCHAIFPPESEVTVQKQSEFLQTYGMEEVDATRSWLTGYSPMIHDYENCSVLLISSTQKSS